MELSITAPAPREGGDSRPMDRFAFEGLLCRACVCLCVCSLSCVVFVSGGGGDTKTGPLKDKVGGGRWGLKPDPSSVNHCRTHTHALRKNTR